MKPTDFSQLVPDGVPEESLSPIWGKTFPDLVGRMVPSMRHGGLVFFDVLRSPDASGLVTLLRCLGVPAVLEHHCYEVRSGQPLRDGFHRQKRIVSALAMKFYFQTTPDPASAVPPEQIDKSFLSFVQEERAQYHDGMSLPEYRERIKASEAEDGTYRLGFAILVENAYFGVFRMWSRPVFFPR